jgi:hypothetical protein
VPVCVARAGATPRAKTMIARFNTFTFTTETFLDSWELAG